MEYIENFATHNLTKFNFEYIWKTDSLDNKKDFYENCKIKSPFIFHNDHDIKFCLFFTFKNIRNNNNVFLNLQCYPNENVNSSIAVNLETSFLDTENKKFCNANKFFIFSNSLSQELCMCTYQTLERNLSFFNENNQLKIFLKFTIGYVKTNKFVLQQKALLCNEKHSDVVFLIDNVKIPALTAILSSHSPVFESMFNHKNTKEAQEKIVNISDVSAEVFKKFLEFIYTGKQPQNNFFELLIVAEKYQVDELKNHCEEIIASELNVKDVVATYQFADLNNAVNLKQQCLKFIAFNLNKIIPTEDWELFCNFAKNAEIVEVTRAFNKTQTF